MKKTIKKTSKKTAKKADILMNYTNCETSTDVLNAYIDAKVKANKPITQDELEIVENRNPKVEIVAFCECVPVSAKKPWYKRFWNWLTRK